MFRFGRGGGLALLLLVFFADARASTAEPIETRRDLPSGFLLDRLSTKDQKTWQALKKIIYAEDSEGRSLHPKLRALFEELQSSQHTIYVEFQDSEPGCDYTAGAFSIEQLDPEGVKHVAVIKLYLRTIQKAYGNPHPKLKDGFNQLAGLDKLGRFAEVLSHEMAHAVDILFDQERATMVAHVLSTTDQVLEHRLQRKGGKLPPEVERELQQRYDFLNGLEGSAVAAESVVWRELLESQGKRQD